MFVGFSVILVVVIYRKFVFVLLGLDQYYLGQFYFLKINFYKIEIEYQAVKENFILELYVYWDDLFQ